MHAAMENSSSWEGVKMEIVEGYNVLHHTLIRSMVDKSVKQSVCCVCGMCASQNKKSITFLLTCSKQVVISKENL